MASSSRSRKDPRLFDDLPLHPDQPPAKPPRATPQRRPTQPPEALPLFPETGDELTVEAVRREPRQTRSTGPGPEAAVSLASRLNAGLVDLSAVLLVLVATWIGLWWIGVGTRAVLIAPLLFFLLPFSFLYEVFPLAFWGRTPGMARVGLVARSADGRRLSFSQAALRWVAGVVTVVTLGLPLLLIVKTGRSLADRVSGSLILPSR